jgi:hypothetical protein
MSTTTDGFMGAPKKATTLEELTAPPEPKKPDSAYHWAYSLPASVMDSVHWRGTEADLHFGVCEPTIEQLQSIGRDPTRQVSEIIVGYVRALGQIDGDSLVTEMVDGKRVAKLRDVGYMEVEAWIKRIGPKAVQMVVGEWQRLFNPSESEGESMRASRRRG